jgi:hypothetical protein
MKKKLFTCLVIGSAIFLILYVVIARNSSRNRPAQVPRPPRATPGLVWMREQFDQRTKTIDPLTKGSAWEFVNVMRHILDVAGEETRQDLLRRLSNPLRSRPTAVDGDGIIYGQFERDKADRFDRVLIEAFIYNLVKSDDTNKIVPLLAARCPNTIASWPTEFQIAKMRGPAGVELLLAAHKSRARNADSHVLSNCLARAFPTLRSQNIVDDDFVKACERWIEENRTNCYLNFKYAYLPGGGPFFPTKPVPEALRGLFVLGKQEPPW